MKAVTINENKLNIATLPQLLRGFEDCVENIFKSRALMFKIVSVIDSKNLLSKKSAYTKKQLTVLKSRGIDEPWVHTTREVMQGLYDHFSWSQYVKFGMLARNIDMEVAERVSEDALILLNKKRDDIKKMLPQLKKAKGVITREYVQTIIDAKGTKKDKALKKDKIAVNKKVINKTLDPVKLQKALTKALELNQKLHEDNKELRKKVRSYKTRYGAI